MPEKLDKPKTRLSRFRQKFSKRSLERIARVEQCKDIIRDWDDWSNKGFEWLKKAFRAVKPPPVLTIDQWADLYRQITPEFSAESGQWHTDKFEPMREVMRACSPSSKYRRVILVKPAQSGGSEACVLNTVGYTIDVNPRSMLVVFPTLDSCESFSKERLDPMIQAMPSLQEKIVDTSSARGGAASTVKKKKYPGGFLNMVGANSATGLSSRPVPIVIIDEVDLCIKNANKQGNPVKLALSRTTTFPDKKEIILSSPSNDEGEAGIIPFWEEGTQGKLERECPNINCRHYQVLDFSRMDIDTATLSCEACGNFYPQWKWQSRFFRWNYEVPDHTSIASFWLTGLDSPWLDWKIDICEDYINCKKVEDHGDDSLMRVFVNSKLAKYFKRIGKRVDIDLYHERREVYECHVHGAELPDGVVLVTAGIDVQDTFIAYDVTGWGKGKESWGIETGEFQGDPRVPETELWTQLDNFVFNRVWRYSDGTYCRTRLMFIDSGGHCTDDVYRYCKPRHPRCFPIKGVGGPQPIVIGGGANRRRKVVEGVWLIRVGVDTLKEEFHSRLSVANPGPGYCHWPQKENGMPSCGYTLEYFEEILAEQRELTYDKSGFAKFAWTKNRTDANEAFDTRNYARAALEYLRVKLEQIPRDVLAIEMDSVEKVELSSGQTIYVKKSDIKNIARKVRYGSRTTPGEDEDEISREVRQEAQSRKGSKRSTYGAANTPSF